MDTGSIGRSRINYQIKSQIYEYEGKWPLKFFFRGQNILTRSFLHEMTSDDVTSIIQLVFVLYSYSFS